MPRDSLPIGCAPCTPAIAPGEPERAGRWWWEMDDKRGMRAAWGREPACNFLSGGFRRAVAALVLLTARRLEPQVDEQAS